MGTMTHLFGLMLRAARSKDAVVVTNSKIDAVPVFNLGTLEEYQETGELTHSVSVTHRAPPGELTTRETLALAVLASDDKATASALADFAIEEGVDYGEAAHERGLAEGQARERERVRVAASDFIREFRRLTIGTGTRSAYDQAYIQNMENALLELAGLLASGQPYDRWEAERRAEQFRQEYEARFISWESFLGAAMYQPTMDAILQGLGIPPEVYNPPGGVEIVGNNRAWTGEGPT